MQQKVLKSVNFDSMDRMTVALNHVFYQFSKQEVYYIIIIYIDSPRDFMNKNLTKL